MSVAQQAQAQSLAGHHVSTQLTLALSFLRSHANPIRIEDLAILSHVEGLLDTSSDLFDRFITHERVEKIGETGAVVYKPDYKISSPATLLTILRTHALSTTAKSPGLSIKKLKESWAHVGPAIEELEKEGKILISRSVSTKGGANAVAGADKGEGVPKMIFLNEVEGKNQVDKEFIDLWRTLKTPDQSELAAQLIAEGLTTSSSIGSGPKGPVGKQKKKKGAGSRKLKITNVHSKELGVDLSRDYVGPGKAGKK